MSKHRLFPQNPLLSLASTVILITIFGFYAGQLVPLGARASFSQNYADALLLGVILLSITLQFKATSSLVDPIYWLLLGASFASWFSLTLLHIFVWQSLSASSQILLTNLAYFLFYSLAIAAIEVKSYQKAKELLTTQSLLIWLSTFCFTLGAYVFLVLTISPTSTTDTSHIPFSFIFYMVMDLYISLRWLHLCWMSRRSIWISYLLFGLASVNWAIADLFEALDSAQQIKLNSGSWHDWLWYTPYIFAFTATQIRQTNPRRNNLRYFSRTHLLNSPVFFLMASFVLHQVVTSRSEVFAPLNSTQNTLFYFWFSILLLLAIAQMMLLNHRVRTTEKNLLEVNDATQVMQQRLLQQAQTLKEQAASNQTILETTHNAIFTLNVSGTVLSCNPAACQLLGLNQQQIIGEPFIECIQAEGELARYFTYQSYHRKITAQTGGIEIESLITNADGVQLPVHATLSQDNTNAEGLLVVSLVNISEQKRAEHEALTLKDQFTANISHEFRTPLTIINGVLDNLIAQERYEQDQAQLATAKRNGLRMIRMVEQLLELSRIANDPLPLEPLNIQPEVDFICRSFIEIAKNQDIQFEFNLPDSAWVHGNPKALEKILFNLLSNAFKYTLQGKVSVVLARDGEFYSATISDTGIGMNESQLAHIFERFHRVDNEMTQSVPGVGIGLALVRELCDALGWQIQVTSVPQQGTQFTLSMPVAPAESGIAGTVEAGEIDNAMAVEVMESRKTGTLPGQSKSKYSVLIVEDNADMQQHINAILSPHHQCLLASNGEEGLRLALDYLPDIVISDVMMPGISGFELLKSLKKSEMTTHIPVILLTARGDNASKIRGLQSEADDYLSKPFDADELRLRVNNQLTSRQKLQLKLASQWQKSHTNGSDEVVITDKFITKLDRVFDANFQDCDFTLVELANALAMSDRQVQRKVKALLGISPLEALKQFRLKKARRLLENGDQIGVVAQTCGFSSQSYFGRCFKETYQQTPKAFQQSLHV